MIIFFSVKYALALSIKTVPSNIAPKKNLTQNIPTSSNNNPFVIKLTNSAPNIVPKTVILPPDRSVPPKTGAKNAGNNQSKPK